MSNSKTLESTAHHNKLNSFRDPSAQRQSPPRAVQKRPKTANAKKPKQRRKDHNSVSWLETTTFTQTTIKINNIQIRGTETLKSDQRKGEYLPWH